MGTLDRPFLVAERWTGWSADPTAVQEETTR